MTALDASVRTGTAMPSAVGVDIGGSSAKLGVVDALGRVVVRHLLPTPEADVPEAVAEGYAQGIESLLERAGAADFAGIGIGVPGHLSADCLRATCSNVPAIDDFPLADFLTERLRRPVRLDNDATLAALAEHRFGAGSASRRLLVATLGTGIGLGLIVDGEPQRPVRGCMGDPGHMIVDPRAVWKCLQGCRGCLESVASSAALEREAADVAARSPDSGLARALARDGRLRTADVIAAARQGDDAAVAILHDAGQWLGMAAASWCHLYDPDLILFGGGMSAAGETLLSAVRRTMKVVGMPEYVTGAKVGLAALGNDAGTIGAASLFLPSQSTH